MESTCKSLLRPERPNGRRRWRPTGDAWSFSPVIVPRDDGQYASGRRRSGPIGSVRGREVAIQ
jgi:hypothetical protein